MIMEQQELIIQCEFSESGENMQEILTQSFELYLARVLAEESQHTG